MKQMLNDLIVAISGGAGRLGSAFSKAVVENGGKVIIGDINSELGHQLVSDLGENDALFFEGNLTEPDAVNLMIIKGKEKFGEINAAVHCAYPVSNQWGIRFEDLKPAGIREDLFNQLGGAILFSQRMILHFQKQGHGNLIHISSIQGVAAPKFEHYDGTDMVSPIEYSAIKAGIISITRYLAKYCKNQNIRVNSISPGGILDKQPESFLKKYKSSCQSKGMLDASDIIGALIFLLSNQSKYVNGQNIIVDDGWSL
jgi:NAD(P)-dependent dehydrogenase (short-subunit alcohol dehydrogenase family)